MKISHFKIMLAASLLGLSLLSLSAIAEIAVITHPDNVAVLDKSTIQRIFLGRLRRYPDAGRAIPVGLNENEAATDEFNSKVLNKNASQLKAYWLPLVFTGKGAPPKVMSTSEVLKAVANSPNMIGYVDSTAVTADVKVVIKF